MREIEDKKRPDMEAENVATITKTVYQLVAVGYLKISDKQMMLYDNKAYKTEEEAEAAIPEYKRSVLAPNEHDELMELKEDPLRVFVKPLEVQ